MKFQYEHELDIPFHEKTFILPNDRKIFFKNLIDNYKLFCPEMKLVYAYLNYNSKNPVEYLLIFKGMSGGEEICLWDVPFLYSNRTLPAYRYICRNNLYKNFFLFCKESLCRVKWSRFLEYIPSTFCELSTDPNDPKYWKKPENGDALVKGMIELSVQYTPKPGQVGVKIIPHKKDVDRLKAMQESSSKK